MRWPAPDLDSEGGYRYYRGPSDGVSAGADADALADGGGTPSSRPDPGEEWTFATPSGRAHFSTPGGETSLPEPTDDDYPLVLTTAREPDGYNTGIRSRPGEDPGPVTARVHPETVAAHAGDAAGTVTLATRRGSVAARVEPDPAVPAGTVWLPIHHPRTNDLTLPAVDPRSDEPNFKQCAARLGGERS